MRNVSVVLLFALVSPALAQDEESRLRQLEERIAVLEKENEALRKKIEWLQRMREFPDGTKPQVVTIRLGGQPERGHLKGIDPPATATKEQTREYVAKILRAASHNGAYGADDPEVEFLERVGPANVDVLIEPLVNVDVLNGDIYLVEALKTLVREEHKDLILKSLPSAQELVKVVLARGWTEDAAPILLERLADRRSWTNHSLPFEWIVAVASLKRPGSYGDLKTYFYYGLNRYDTWKEIRNLPGMDLNAEVKTLWPWAKELDDKWVRVEVAAVAAHYGHLDALEVLFEDPRGWPAWEVIESVTPYRGERREAEEARKWFEIHRDRLVLDPAKGTYRLAGQGETRDD
jgi:hypothetical protein